MKRVITYGTFDLLHYGHINLLKRAKQLGDYLIVVVSSDEFNLKEKNKVCYFNYEHRKNLVEAIRYVDLVIPETSWEQKKLDVKEYHIDTFVMGDDWKGKFDYLEEEGVEVVYLPRTKEISTTKIKEDLSEWNIIKQRWYKNYSFCIEFLIVEGIAILSDYGLFLRLMFDRIK